jgi:hypothetical protein
LPASIFSPDHEGLDISSLTVVNVSAIDDDRTTARELDVVAMQVVKSTRRNLSGRKKDLE